MTTLRITCVLAAGLLSSAGALAQTFDFPTPAADRWHYPFNFTPGNRATGSCFGAPAIAGFNDRDGILVLAWDTSGLIATGQPLSSYAIDSVTVTMTHVSNPLPTWIPDTTVDEWFTFDLNGDGFINQDGFERGHPNDTDGESDDVDAGRPIELFGTEFGPTYTASTWTEFSPYVGSADDPNNETPRDPFPYVFDPNGNPLAVEDSVRGNFTPQPWAIGEPQGYTGDPNNTTAPFDVTFSLNVNDPQIEATLQQQLRDGRLVLSVTSLAETAFFGGGVDDFPSFFMKEDQITSGAKPAALQVVLGAASCPGDTNGDNLVDLSDLGALLANFGASGANLSQGDLNGDTVVDLTDLGILLSLFGTSC